MKATIIKCNSCNESICEAEEEDWEEPTYDPKQFKDVFPIPVIQSIRPGTTFPDLKNEFPIFIESKEAKTGVTYKYQFIADIKFRLSSHTDDVCSKCMFTVWRLLLGEIEKRITDIQIKGEDWAFTPIKASDSPVQPLNKEMQELRETLKKVEEEDNECF